MPHQTLQQYRKELILAQLQTGFKASALPNEINDYLDKILSDSVLARKNLMPTKVYVKETGCPIRFADLNSKTHSYWKCLEGSMQCFDDQEWNVSEVTTTVLISSGNRLCVYRYTPLLKKLEDFLQQLDNDEAHIFWEHKGLYATVMESDTNAFCRWLAYILSRFDGLGTDTFRPIDIVLGKHNLDYCEDGVVGFLQQNDWDLFSEISANDIIVFLLDQYPYHSVLTKVARAVFFALLHKRDIRWVARNYNPWSDEHNRASDLYLSKLKETYANK